MDQNFCHLHCHSQYSYLDGFGSHKKYASVARRARFTHLAMTDHGNVDGAIKFQKECEKNNIIPIFGAELYIVPDIILHEKGEKRAHVSLFAKNEVGWNNLLKLITLSNIEGFYYRPRISPELLAENREGLIISTACSASFLSFPWGENFLKRLIDQSTEDLYLEIMPHNFQEQKDVNVLCQMYSEKYSLPLIATNDSHFVNSEDVLNHEVLLAVQIKKKWKDPKRWKFKDSGSYFLKTREEMIESFEAQGALSSRECRRALINTMEVAEKCSGFTKIPEKKIHLPLPESLAWEDEIFFLKNLCESGMHRIGKKGEDAYQERLEEEINLIVRQDFVRYFLIVWELIEWCKKNDIFISPGRGSSAGSLVCYLIGITGVDPIKYNLLFSRFINPDRISLPDIDIDFPDVKRHLIRDHLGELYGEWNVNSVSTTSVMGGKQALRDVSRVFDVPYVDVDRGCSAIISRLKGDEGYGETIKEAFEMFEDGKWFARKYPKVAKISAEMESTIRNKGVHAAALVISDEDLRGGTRCAFTVDKDKNPVINWDKDDIEHVGLIKLDVLGLSMLSVLEETKRLIKENRGVDLNFKEIPLDDEKCFSEFSKGNNVGCFQVGSRGLRKYCKQVGVDNFNTLVDITALYRPGPLNSGISDLYIKRKKGLEETPGLHHIYDEITKDTYGLLIYQEQIMMVANLLAGLKWGVCDKIRKDIAKSKGKDALRKYEEQFVEGCVEKKTLTDEQAYGLWNNIVEYGKYSFNKSHSVVYTMLTYWDQYLKQNYPTEFICALLTYGASGTEKDAKKTEFVQEAFRLGIDVRFPKVGISDPFLWSIKDNILYAPFIEIKGVGEKTAKSFKKLEAKGFYEGSEEKEPVTKRFLNILDIINAYDNVAITDEEADRLSEYTGLSFVRDSLYQYKKFINFLNGSGIKIEKAKDIKVYDIDSNMRYYFGKIEELKLSTFKGSSGKKASVSVLFRDETGDLQFSFDKTYYNENIEEIEHSEDSYVLIKINMPQKSGNIVCHRMWFAEDLLRGRLEGLKLKPVKRARYKNTELLECKECQLEGECTLPVLPSRSTRNIMIIGEAPGADEDRTGVGFVGDSGKKLWEQVEDNSFTRRDFHVTNVCKCYPGRTIKTPTKKHIEKCSMWLDDEFERIEPFVALACGNTSIKFFTDEESGIMNKSGELEWNEKYGCFISWVIHPASTIYNPENKEMFRDGIKNFCDFIKRFE
ncbi:MAG: DNA polymerase III subunit alpha [PVC group bacterium]|nr:DNA polymerase III subunit alpha [PVC group bacterium]